jgi:biopolymer transport protein ExbD
MAMAAGGDSGNVKANINVTPLVDVVLVLLIIFMVVTPMLQRGKDVTLPKAQKKENSTSKPADEPLILSVTADKKMYLDKDEFGDAQLEKELRYKYEASPGRKLLLKGDTTLNFEDVRKAMNIARLAGAKGVALGVEELKE